MKKEAAHSCGEGLHHSRHDVLVRTVSPASEVLIVCALSLFAFLLRVYRLSEQSLWYDEIVSYSLLNVSDYSVFQQLLQLIHADNGPLYYLAQYAWGKTMGVSVFSIRLLSVLVSVSAVPAWYALVRRMHSPQAASVAALLLAAAPQHIWHGQAIRPYAFFDIGVVLSLYCLYRLTTEKKCRWLAGNVFANTLLVWLHPFMVFLFPCQTLFLAVQCDVTWRRKCFWLLAHILIVASIVLWLYPSIPHIPEAAEDHFVLPGWRDVLLTTVGFDSLQMATETPVALLGWWRGAYAGGWLPTSFESPVVAPALYVRLPGALMRLLQRIQPAMDGMLMAGVAMALMWLLLQGRFVLRCIYRRQSLETEQQAVMLLVLTALAPMLTMAALSYLWRPCFELRFILYSSLGVYGALGIIFAVNNWPRLRLTLLVFVVLGYGYQLLFLVPNTSRTDWSGVAAHIEVRRLTGEPVLVTGNLPVFAPCALKAHFQDERIEVVPAYALASVCEKVAGHVQRHAGAQRGIWAVIELMGYSYEGLVEVLDARLAPHNISHQSWIYPGMTGLALFYFEGSTPIADMSCELPPIPSRVDYEAEIAWLGVSREHPYYSQYKTDLRRVCDKHFWHTAFLHTMIGMMLVEERAFETALVVARAAVANYPDYPLAYLLLAAVFYSTGNLDDAYKTFQHGRAISDVYLAALVPFFDALILEDDPQAARQVLDELSVCGYPYAALRSIVAQ